MVHTDARELVEACMLLFGNELNSLPVCMSQTQAAMIPQWTVGLICLLVCCHHLQADMLNRPRYQRDVCAPLLIAPLSESSMLHVNKSWLQVHAAQKGSMLEQAHV